ncbi:MAG TPA: hypothetical protein VJR24_06390 [Gemmatimonadaceae bacterium]|nr:hypothetical protein [Gemmatimonadaceae bacterium]
MPEPRCPDATTHSQQRSITLRNQPGDSVIFGEVDDADRALEPRLLERIAAALGARRSRKKLRGPWWNAASQLPGNDGRTVFRSAAMTS